MENIFNTINEQLGNDSLLLLDNLRLITDKMKCHQNRVELSERKHYWNILTKLVNRTRSDLTINCESISNNYGVLNDIITEIFRLLRNCCVNCAPNQALILSNESLFNDCVVVFKSICDFYSHSKTDANEELKCQLIAMIKCALQCYGNLLAKSDCNAIDECDKKRKVWQIFEFDLLRELLAFEDKNVSIIASMVFYNCVINNNDLIDKSLSNDKLLPIIDALLCHISDECSEWSLWSIERMINIKDFLSIVFANISSKSKIILLDVIHESIKNAKTGEQNELNESNLVYLVELFKTSVNYVISIDKCDDNNYDITVIIASKLLPILCELTANETHLTRLQTDTELMTLLVNTLKSIHTLGKTDAFSKFKPLRRLKQVTEDEIDAESPVFGFKKNLIRLIGNLVYNCCAIQDAVRDSDGIIVILDCCNIDARNPFIMEWSIFAINNLMKNNQMNQKLIYNLSKNGDLVNDELTNQFLF